MIFQKNIDNSQSESDNFEFSESDEEIIQPKVHRPVVDYESEIVALRRELKAAQSVKITERKNKITPRMQHLKSRLQRN